MMKPVTKSNALPLHIQSTAETYSIIEISMHQVLCYFFPPNDCDWVPVQSPSKRDSTSPCSLGNHTMLGWGQVYVISKDQRLLTAPSCTQKCGFRHIQSLFL